MLTCCTPGCSIILAPIQLPGKLSACTQEYIRLVFLSLSVCACVCCVVLILVSVQLPGKPSSWTGIRFSSS